MTDKAPARKVKTPEARALEQVAILQRRLAKIRTTKDTLELQVKNIKVDEIAVQKRLDYAKASPDLPVAKEPAEEVTPPP